MLERAAAILRRPLIAAIVLLVAYVGLAFLSDPHGYLGTDTGGKVATLQAMDRSGSFDPDVGYWAQEWDRDATYHPLYYTSRVGDRFINVTTLPVVLAAKPLYDLGGYRLALLLPMFGSIAAAFAARALAERVRPGRGWPAFWVTGLAGSLTIYALDFWEHSIGVALMAWGVVAVLAALERKSAALGLLAGLAFGFAFTLRTEALVYAFITLAVGCLVAVGRKEAGRAVQLGGAAVVGMAGAAGCNYVLEHVVLSQGLRASRAAGAATSGGGTLAFRLREGLTTTFSLSGSDNAAILVGVVVVVLLAYVVLKSRADQPLRDERLIVAAGAVVALMYVLNVTSHGLGFVPGFLMAMPLGAVALALAWRDRNATLICAIALLAVPLVWLFQYSGGALPQWGGRYVLPTAFLLSVMGIAMLSEIRRPTSWFLLGLSVAVTLMGVAWVGQRSDEIADAGRTLAGRQEPVLVSDVGFWFREFGATALEHRWLSAASVDTVPAALDIVTKAGFNEFGLVESADPGASTPAFSGWHATATSTYTWLGTPFRVVTYQRS
jgi:hypothetical protein